MYLVLVLAVAGLAAGVVSVWLAGRAMRCDVERRLRHAVALARFEREPVVWSTFGVDMTELEQAVASFEEQTR